MRKGVKILLSTALMLLLFVSAAAAKPTDWSDPQYAFQSIHSFTVDELDLNQLVESEGAGRSMQAICQAEAAKQLDHAKLQPKDMPADVRITGQVLQYDVTDEVRPAHYETQYYEETTTIRDKDGKESKITRQVPRKEYVPARTVYTSTVRLRLDVIDQKTGKEVFSRDDTRTDEDSSNIERTYSKLVTAFYKEVDRKIRKG